MFVKMADIAKFLEMFSQQMETLVRSITANSTTIPNFIPFEPSKELWNHYMSRFQTFIEANSILKQILSKNYTSFLHKSVCFNLQALANCGFTKANSMRSQ